MDVNVRSVGVVRVGVCILCVDDREECEGGVGDGVNDTKLSETLSIVGVAEAVGKTFYFIDFYGHIP